VKNKDLIQHNIDNTRVLTQENIENLSSPKEYHSGRPILQGDKLLIGMLHEYITETQCEVKLIRFHPEEYGTLYEAAFPEFEMESNIPSLKYK
jgi:hypothetical protein